MSQNLQKFAIFQKLQVENLVDFEKCCKTHIFLQKSEPVQPKTSNTSPKFCQPTLSDGPSPSGPGSSPRRTWTPRRTPSSPGSSRRRSATPPRGKGSPPRARGCRATTSAASPRPMFFLTPSWNGFFSNFYLFSNLPFENHVLKISKIFVAKSQEI